MSIQIELTDDDAIVLFEWLCLLIEGKQLDTVHPAERQVLWNLQCELERQLVPPFQPDYIEQLEEAKKRLSS